MADDAKISISADSAQVARVARASVSLFKDAASSIGGAFKDAAHSIVTDLGGIVTSAGKVNFSAQREQVKDFEASTARLAVSAGRDLEQTRQGFEKVGASIGRRPGEVAAWASEVGKLTYNFEGAGEAIEGISGLAAETGRSVDDYRGFATVLGTIGKVGGDTRGVLGQLAAQAEQTGMKGGAGMAAFADEVEGLGDQISHMSRSSVRDFLAITATAATVGQGLDAAGKNRVAQGALGLMNGGPIQTFQLEAYLGRRIRDEQGRVAMVDKKTGRNNLADLVTRIKKTYGGQAEEVLSQMTGSTETGAALFRADWKKASALMNVAPSGAPQAAQAALNATDAGKRAIADATLSGAARDLVGSSSALGKAADALQQYASHNPIAATAAATIGGNVVSSAFGSGVTSTAKNFAKAFAPKALKVGGTALTAAGGWVLGGLAAAAGGAAVGMGADYLTGKLTGRSISDRFAGVDSRGHYVQDERDKLDPKAITAAMKEGVRQITIVNSTGGPIEVVNGQASSGAAGPQGAGR